MERYKEMWQAVEKEHGQLSRRESMVALTALEWADKTMIEKACKWLYVYYPTLERSKSAEDAWDKFKKAMEE